ncbi:hypothetical protein [Rippkaea orientalis]|uniref:hypothetical protein n=1 Tax=Rippkaea orientalis TaxID=2546366 RepID=UPI0012FF583E
MELQESPSLNNFILDILVQSYATGLENVQDSYPDSYFSHVCPFPRDIEELLNNRFWEVNSREWEMGNTQQSLV